MNQPNPTERSSVRHRESGARLAAFTLVELLSAVAIIAALVALLSPLLAGIQNSAQRTSTMSNMRQLGLALMTYANDNDGKLPLDKGATDDSWVTSTEGLNDGVWYNALPRIIGKKGVADYGVGAGKWRFYSKENLLFCPGAPYPPGAPGGLDPIFAIAFNSKLIQSTVNSRMSTIQRPSVTVAFLEAGLISEPKYRLTQSNYNAQAAVFASRFVTRYMHRKAGIMVFFDGHAALMPGEEVVAPEGKAYFPQLGTGGSVLWTADPDADANS